MMRYTFFPIAVAAISLGLCGSALAQGPAGDEIKITFDRPVMVGSQTLPAGEYLIRQVTSGTDPRVLQFLSSDGTQLDATVTATPIMQNTPPSETRAVLQDEGGGARLSRIWVQGRTYGYGFPGTAAPAHPTTTATLQGSYAPAAAPSAERAAPPPQPQPQPETPPPATPAPQPEAQPAPAPEQPAPAPAPAPMPATALGWADLTSAGLTLAAAGLLFYWRSQRRAASR